MQIAKIILGDFSTNTYILYNEDNNQCLLIDPADSAEQIIDVLISKQLNPVAILLTHGHYDHILAVPKIEEKWNNIPVYCHPLDIPKETAEYDMGKEYPTVAAFSNILPLYDGQKLDLEGIKLEVIHTPGHTPGSVIFKTEEALFTGDTLFRGSIGRTDFAGGNKKQIEDSLEKICKLDIEDCLVLAGHDSQSTLAWERKHNPYLKTNSL